jgi:DNA-binding transcriptional LysR family regulator
MIDTRHLQTFQAIAKSGSFTHAADMLGCVQSNVTARMRKLEQQLGTALFERDGRNTKLTSAGHRLESYADQIVSLIEEAETIVTDEGGERAELRLGGLENATATRLPTLIKRLHERFPDAPLSLVTGTTDELVTAVLDRQIDAAFVAGEVDHDMLDSVEAFRETMVRVSPKGQNSPAPLIAFRQGCSYRALAEQWLRSIGAVPVPIIEMGTLDGMLGCVKAGVGMAVVPRISAENSAHRDGFDIEDLPTPFGDSRTALIWQRDRTPTKPLLQLIDYITEGTA